MTGSSPVILITGASSGIGAAAARLFAAEGYRLVLTARRQARLQALADECQSAGAQAIPVVADLALLETPQALAQSALAAFGRIDILFNNAGFGRINWLETLDAQQDIEAVLQVNLVAPVQLARALLPQMIARRQGHIVNMASLAGLVGSPSYSVYAASKFGLRGFGEALRREVGVFGIHVSTIFPGGVETEFAEHAGLYTAAGIRRKTGYTTPPALRLTAEQVARKVLDVVRHPRPTVVMPAAMLPVVWLNALFPALVDWAVERWFVRRERF